MFNFMMPEKFVLFLRKHLPKKEKKARQLLILLQDVRGKIKKLTR